MARIYVKSRRIALPRKPKLQTLRMPANDISCDPMTRPIQLKSTGIDFPSSWRWQRRRENPRDGPDEADQNGITAKQIQEKAVQQRTLLTVSETEETQRRKRFRPWASQKVTCPRKQSPDSSFASGCILKILAPGSPVDNRIPSEVGSNRFIFIWMRISSPEFQQAPSRPYTSGSWWPTYSDKA